MPVRPAVALCLLVAAAAAAADPVAVEIVEAAPDDTRRWDVPGPAAETFAEPALAVPAVPEKYTPTGVLAGRGSGFLVRATAAVRWPAGDYRLLLRSRAGARLLLDGKVLADIPFPIKGPDGHLPFAVPPAPAADGLPPLRVDETERVVTVPLDGAAHALRLEVYVGGRAGKAGDGNTYRPEAGEPAVAVAGADGVFRLAAPSPTVPFAADAWPRYVADRKAAHAAGSAERRRAAAARDAGYWAGRHDLARAEWAKQPPPAFTSIDAFVTARGVTPAPAADDWAFLRRVHLDTVGVPPTPAEIDAFFADPPADRRPRVIDRLLADPRWADHWVSYWQDVLAENPGLLRPTLNNSGPFRKYLHDALADNLPFDRFVTELVRMDGSPEYGGPAGFGVATENDAPMAAKAGVLAKAFLAADLQCARCHDAPGKAAYLQRHLFGLAAMLDRKPVKLPASSTVPVAEGARKPAVKITLKPGATIAPEWGLAAVAPTALPKGVLRSADDPRERFAALLTSPANARFADVAVNRLWARWLGRGLVEPVDDWAGADPLDPGLLRFLARELATRDYDLKHVARLILNSGVYQRLPGPNAARLAGPAPRRATAEQVVDSLFAVAGKPLSSEEQTFDPGSRQPVRQCQNFGVPRRAWQLVATANERDRSSLLLPETQSVLDLMAAYGWRESRPNSVTVRDDPTTPLQPMALANGVVGQRACRLSDDSALTALCLEGVPLPDLIGRLTRRILTRPPTAAERAGFEGLLRDGYETRRREAAPVVRRDLPDLVTWANHLRPEADAYKLEQAARVRAGDPPTNRLAPDWRERAEDVVWALVNSPGFVVVP